MNLGQKLAMGAVLLYLLVNAFAAIPYLTWIKRKRTVVDDAIAPRHHAQA